MKITLSQAKDLCNNSKMEKYNCLTGTPQQGSFHERTNDMGFLTCEQASNGHPDKICDQISDAVLTDCLQYDLDSHVW